MTWKNACVFHLCLPQDHGSSIERILSSRKTNVLYSARPFIAESVVVLGLQFCTPFQFGKSNYMVYEDIQVAQLFVTQHFSMPLGLYWQYSHH